MGAFLGIVQTSVRPAVELHAIVDQLIDDLLRGINHDLNALFVVFVVSCPQGVLKKRREVVLSPQNTDAALCEIGVTFLHAGFGDHGDFQVPRQIQRTVQARAAASNNQYIGIHVSVLTRIYS